jgi:hypothetical protein
MQEGSNYDIHSVNVITKECRQIFLDLIDKIENGDVKKEYL